MKRGSHISYPGFHVGPLSRSNRNLEMLVLVKGGKPDNPEKTLSSNLGENATTNSTGHQGGNQTVVLTPLCHHNLHIFFINQGQGPYWENIKFGHTNIINLFLFLDDNQD